MGDRDIVPVIRTATPIPRPLDSGPACSRRNRVFLDDPRDGSGHQEQREDRSPRYPARCRELLLRQHDTDPVREVERQDEGDAAPGMTSWIEEEPMKLTQQQIDDFNRDGWLFLPELFTSEETALLAREAEGIYAADRPEVWREKSGAPRTAFAAHLYNEAFRLLGAHPRMIEPIEQIFGERVYMHQFKINAKSAFTGDVWQWHQDYGTWKRDDGMPEPRAMNIAIFLDEVMPINGPLMLVPQSQHAGDLKASHDLATTSYPLWTLDEETVTRLVKQGGIVAPTGKPGGMLMFHGNLVHGSAGNITPFPRKIVYLTLNAVSNYIRTPTRPDYIAHRDFRPIETGGGRRPVAAGAGAASGGGVAIWPRARFTSPKGEA